MKGTEGIDCVITECGHCKGSGKCNCHSCITKSSEEYFKKDNSQRYGFFGKDSFPDYIKGLKEEKAFVNCNICKGVGKVVFWRE